MRIFLCVWQVGLALRSLQYLWLMVPIEILNNRIVNGTKHLLAEVIFKWNNYKLSINVQCYHSTGRPTLVDSES